MFENIAKFFKRLVKSEQQETAHSKDMAKERLHLVLMQDRANVSTDFLELMKQEIIEVIKKYIEVDDKAIDVRLTNKVEDDGTNGSPFLYANIPIVKIKNEAKSEEIKKEENEEKENPITDKKDNKETKDDNKKEEKSDEIKENIEEKANDGTKEEVKEENIKNVEAENLKEELEKDKEEKQKDIELKEEKKPKNETKK